MKRLGFIIVVLLLATVVQAQDPLIEYGDASELATVKTVYIYTGMDMKSRQKIIGAIKRYDKNGIIQLVDNVVEADISLTYVRDTVDNGSYSQEVKNLYTGEHMGYSTGRRVANIGNGTAAKVDLDRNVTRLLWQFEGSQGNRLQKSPERKFAKQFIEAMEKAKGLK